MVRGELLLLPSGFWEMACCAVLCFALSKAAAVLGSRWGLHTGVRRWSVSEEMLPPVGMRARLSQLGYFHTVKKF